MIHIRARRRSILLVGYRGRSPNEMVDEVVADWPRDYSKSCSFESTDCSRVRSTENGLGEETGMSRETL